MRKASSLTGFIILVFACAALGSWFTFQGVNDWYQTISKPAWTPPSWIFGPIWTGFYITIAVSAWLIWEGGHPGKQRALTLWGIQLGLNVFWSACFFAWQNPALALVEIVLLWASILATILVFKPLNRYAAWLLIPYLCWVSFATALNAAIWRLN